MGDFKPHDQVGAGIHNLQEMPALDPNSLPEAGQDLSNETMTYDMRKNPGGKNAEISLEEIARGVEEEEIMELGSEDLEEIEDGSDESSQEQSELTRKEMFSYLHDLEKYIVPLLEDGASVETVQDFLDEYKIFADGIVERGHHNVEAVGIAGLYLLQREKDPKKQKELIKQAIEAYHVQQRVSKENKVEAQRRKKEKKLKEVEDEKREEERLKRVQEQLKENENLDTSRREYVQYELRQRFGAEGSVMSKEDYARAKKLMKHLKVDHYSQLPFDSESIEDYNIQMAFYEAEKKEYLQDLSNIIKYVSSGGDIANLNDEYVSEIVRNANELNLNEDQKRIFENEHKKREGKKAAIKTMYGEAVPDYEGEMEKRSLLKLAEAALVNYDFDHISDDQLSQIIDNADTLGLAEWQLEAFLSVERYRAMEDESDNVQFLDLKSITDNRSPEEIARDEEGRKQRMQADAAEQRAYAAEQQRQKNLGAHQDDPSAKTAYLRLEDLGD